MPTTLAAADLAGKAGEILIAGALLILFFLALGLGLWYYRRWRGESEAPSSAPWTLDDLRKLRNQGKLTEDEYQHLRDTVIGLYTRGPSAPAASDLPAASRASKLDAEDEGDEKWDWIAEEDPRSGGFDVKK